jgi:DNA-binding XRE family transcriptional regulator
MSEHMRKHPTRGRNTTLCMHHAGIMYRIPIEVAERYRIKSDSISAERVFAEIDAKYSKPGALLRGIRAREDLTQSDMARKLKVTQSDISQMENGRRKVGRKIAQRIEKLFGTPYRSFLE